MGVSFILSFLLLFQKLRWVKIFGFILLDLKPPVDCISETHNLKQRCACWQFHFKKQNNTVWLFSRLKIYYQCQK